MRTLVDIPDEDVAKLDVLAKRRGKSRAAEIREAITNYLALSEKVGIEKYFGLWERHGSKVDGLEYERELRDEWPNAGDLKPPKKRRDAA
jgi:plasmid stability protein